MARAVADNEAMVITSPITHIQLHLYPGKECSFTNAFMTSLTQLISPNIAPEFHFHAHPHNALTAAPFSIINGQKLHDSQSTFDLLFSLVELSYTQHAHPDQPNPQNSLQSAEIMQMLQGLLQQCWELSVAASVTSEDDSNPYYIFLNPLLKWSYYRRQDQQRRHLQAATQFLTVSEELNGEYLIYRLEMLQKYVEQLQRKRLSLCHRKVISSCLLAMLQHFEDNHPAFLEVSLKEEMLQRLYQNRQTAKEQMQEYQKRAVDEQRKVAGTYLEFRLPAEQKEEKQEEYQTLKERFLKAIVQPLSVTAIVLMLRKFF